MQHQKTAQQQLPKLLITHNSAIVQKCGHENYFTSVFYLSNMNLNTCCKSQNNSTRNLNFAKITF